MNFILRCFIKLYQSLEAENSGFNIKLSDLESEIFSLKTKNAELLQNYCDIKAENTDLKEKIKPMNENIVSLTSEKESLATNLSKLVKDITIEKDPINFYDIILDIESLKDLPKGWKIESSIEGRKRVESFQVENSCVVGVVGNFNKGKSFVLHKIADVDIPHGHSLQTKGLSVKYPLKMKKSVTLLDSAGFEIPLKIQNDRDKDSKENEVTRICELARDRQLTELFLQSFVIENSDILLLVVGILTFSDQKLLNRLRSVAKNKRMFIIHNLSNFISIMQTKKYVQETLMKTFPLQINKYIDFNEEEKVEETNKVYYVDNSNHNKMIHLIFCRDDSEAGNHYNPTTLDFLKKQIQSQTEIKPFNLLDKVKNHLMSSSKEVMEEESRIKTLEEIQITDNCIKVLNKDILLKKCLVDELGFSRFYGNTFTPNYHFYRDEKEKQFVISIDVPDLDKAEAKIPVVRGEYKVFTIIGKKSVDSQEILKSPEIKTYENKKEIGNFSLEFSIPMGEADRIAKRAPKHKYEKGVLTFTYELANEMEESIIISFK